MFIYRTGPLALQANRSLRSLLLTCARGYFFMPDPQIPAEIGLYGEA